MDITGAIGGEGSAERVRCRIHFLSPNAMHVWKHTGRECDEVTKAFGDVHAGLHVCVYFAVSGFKGGPSRVGVRERVVVRGGFTWMAVGGVFLLGLSSRMCEGDEVTNEVIPAGRGKVACKRSLPDERCTDVTRAIGGVTWDP